MKSIHQNDFCDSLRRRISGASRIAIVGIGDELLPVDRLGMLAAKDIEKLQLLNVKVFFAGTMPENMTAPLRVFRPDHVILLDSADIGAQPGTIAIIKPGRIQANLISVHAMPLTLFMEFIAKDSKTKVTLLGIQPNITRHDVGLSAEEHEYLDQNLAKLFSILSDTRVKN